MAVYVGKKFLRAPTRKVWSEKLLQQLAIQLGNVPAAVNLSIHNIQCATSSPICILLLWRLESLILGILDLISTLLNKCAFTLQSQYIGSPRMERTHL